jgi:diguanylate cyclase (GGDEF)-like protein
MMAMPWERMPASPPGLDTGSWLCRDDLDRERMLDMEQRVRPVRRRTFAIIGVAVLALAPWIGWWPLLFLIPASLWFVAADRLIQRVARPELVVFSAWVGGELMIAGALALEGGHRTAGLSWLAIPVITLSARFSIRGVAAGVAIAASLMLAVAFGMEASIVLANPELVIAPLAVLFSISALSTPLMRSDIQHRSDAVVDQLTGMLNRNALANRARELAQQAAITGEPVGVIVADVDHFKSINDTLGHSAGDVVLKEVAYVLRRELRAFDLAYRLGGEEFLILVPGSDAESTQMLAERLREAIANEVFPAGVAATMSFGVAASERGSPFQYATVFSLADAALYQAKRSGRDRVCLASGPMLPVFAP